jgi:hypothetical protein
LSYSKKQKQMNGTFTFTLKKLMFTSDISDCSKRSIPCISWWNYSEIFSGKD